MKRRKQSKRSDVVVMEGDWGGQIYLTVPRAVVACTEDVLHQLLADIDAIQWQEPEGASLYVDQYRAGDGVLGGMGGGLVTEGVWLHERLERLRQPIEAVLAGRQERLASDLDLVRL